MPESIDVSVIVPTWKAAAFIERAIQSALASNAVNVEVVAVDDASPDATFSVLNQLAAKYPHVTAHQLSKNSGPSAARNLAIATARGSYVAILDADDTMRPERLAKLVALADRSDADIVVDNMIEVDEAGQPIGSEPFLKSRDFAASRDIDLLTWIRFNNPMTGGDTIGYLKPLIRRSTLQRTGVAYDTSLRNSEDYYLIADLLAEKARMIYSPDADYFYTRSSSSTSHRLKPEQTLAWLAAEKRFVARHGAKLSAEEKAALARRDRVLRNVNQLVAITDTLKAKKLAASARLMASDLQGAAYTLGVLSKVAVNRVLRRKSV